MFDPATQELTSEAVVAGDGLTSAESLIWAGQRLDPDSPLYNMALAIEVDGELDVEAARTAFQLLVDGDEVLRTVFRDVGGRPRREVLERLPVEVEVVDLPESEVDDAEVGRLLTDRTRRLLPLDAPLFDTCIIRRRSDRFVLYFNQHHIATDAWSTGVLYRRWGALYREVVAGREPPSSGHPRFAEYCKYERELRTSPQLERALQFWEGSASDGPPKLPFYGNRAEGSGRTQRVRIPLGAERTSHLRRIAGERPFRALTAEQGHYVVFSTLLLAWLHRVTDVSRVSLGSPWHNRPSADLKDTTGLFIELYPLRVSVDEGETLSSLGSKVAEASMQTMRHVVPGASATAGARGYGAVLNYVTASLGDFADLPARADWIHSGFGDPAHKIRLQVHDFDAAGEPTLDFDLDVEVFDESARRWAVQHFLRLFDALAENPDQAVADVPLATWNEEAEYATQGVERAAPASVLPAIRENVTRVPSAVAVIDDGREITFEELAKRVGALAAGLEEEGLGRGDAVGICMERSADLIVAILAVLDVGAAYVPLDPGYPDERLRFYVEDSGVRVLLAAPTHASRIEEWGARVFTVADASRAPDRDGQASGTTREAPSADDLAYVLYTSGSTGRPKGVEVTHGALADYVAWASRTYDGGESLRFPLFTSPAFDLTVTSLFTPLLSGGAVVIYREDVGNSGLLVRKVFEDDQVDVVKLTPSHLALIRDLDLAGSRVRRLIVGGEELTSRAARQAHDQFGGRTEIFNEYGPTEATVACMLHRYDPVEDTDRSVSIGRPADNARVYVMDGRGHPVLRGVRGEIHVGGPRVARGYRGRPELTEAAFLEGAGPDGTRLYRTGDLGRWTARGTLEFLGRSDDQVKVRGVRLELGEVEALLAGHPDVVEVAAQVVRGRSQSEEHCGICGIEAAHPEARLDHAGVCAICRRFEEDRELVSRYFGDMNELAGILESARKTSTGEHDSLMLFSGGKDSTYALCRIVEMGARPLVFMLDNGFISEQAKSNVRRVADQLGLELVVGETPAMPEIFADSLARFSNVCNGCFKTIYTLSMNIAVERGINTVVTGLSRGQIFETRLADLYRRGIHDPAEVDRMILDARKAYHRMDDAVSRRLNVRIFETDDVLDAVRFVDFYRYCDVTLAEVLAYVSENTPWIRPPDTGRSTNCLINQAGISVHQTERGFHNYTLPYSWDVRLGHKERDAVMKELDDDLDPVVVRGMLDEVGYSTRPAPEPEPRLIAYYTAGADVPVSDLRGHLGRTLSAETLPSDFIRLERMPLTRNGKIDRGALPKPTGERPVFEGAFVAPRTPAEKLLAEVWSEVLAREPIGVEDDFFELGGDSMHCIQIVSAALDRGVSFAPRDLFANPTVAGLARVAVTDRSGREPAPATASAAELSELEEEFGG